jgi:hypothetical protein
MPERSETETVCQRQLAYARRVVEYVAELEPKLPALLAIEAERGKNFSYSDISGKSFYLHANVESRDEIVALLKLFAKHGFRRMKTSPVKVDEQNPAQVSFNYHGVHLTILNNGATCKRVITGTRMIEVNDYKIECEGDVPEAELAALAASAEEGGVA